MENPAKKAPISNAPNAHKVFRSACPACHAKVETLDMAADGNFPFCSRRCKLIDLGNWFDEEYHIGGPVEEED